jgi:hypothetical protein
MPGSRMRTIWKMSSEVEVAGGPCPLNYLFTRVSGAVYSTRSKGQSTRRRQHCQVVSRRRNQNGQEHEAEKFFRLLQLGFATSPKPATRLRRAAPSVRFYNRDMHHAKPFVYGLSADDARLTLTETHL